MLQPALDGRPYAPAPPAAPQRYTEDQIGIVGALGSFMASVAFGIDGWRGVCIAGAGLSGLSGVLVAL